MKRIFKLLTTCMIAGLLLFTTAFTAFAEDANADNELYLQYAESIITEVISVPDDSFAETIDYYNANGMPGIAAGFEAWQTYKPTAGAYVQIDSCDVLNAEDGTTVINAKAVFETATLKFTITLDTSGYPQTIAFSTYEENEGGLGSKMKEASVNLVVGMGTVFAVLIFLCWVISLFKNISIIEKKLAAKKAAKAIKNAPAAPKAEPLPLTITPEPASNDELQAVIAAAIAAYEADNGSGIDKQPALSNGISIKTYRRN